MIFEQIHTGLLAPLDRVNVDTDQVVPRPFRKARFAKEARMRTLLAAAVQVGATGITLVSSRTDEASDRAAIQKVLDAQGNPWTKGDAVAA